MEPNTYRDDIATLAESYAEGNLIPFVGAGLSRAGGIPSWKELTLQMFLQVIRLKLSAPQSELLALLDALVTAPDSFEPPEDPKPADDQARHWFLSYLHNEALDNEPITMRYVKTELEHRRGGQFLEALHDQLYRWRTNQECTAYQALGRWCQSRPDNWALEVVNYNYDDLLEQTLSEMGIHSYVSLSQANPRPMGRKRDLSAIIYHPHGLVPQSGAGMTDIVLSEEEYHEQYSNIASWSNLIQLRLLWQGRGLFIGLSMTDPNLRRLMDIVRKGSAGRWHYLLMRRNRQHPSVPDRPKLPPGADELVTAIDRSLEELEQGAFSTLDVKVIWFDEFDEVPQILDCIRLVAEDPHRLDLAAEDRPVWQSVAAEGPGDKGTG